MEQKYLLIIITLGTLLFIGLILGLVLGLTIKEDEVLKGNVKGFEVLNSYSNTEELKKNLQQHILLQ